MAHPKNLSTTTLNKSLQNWDFIPQRRKRHHFNNLSLMLLIFVGCCSTLILWPLDVHAKDLNIATTKGENMLGNDHQHRHQQQGNTLPEGEGNVVSADKTNDNGIFKRLQPSENEEEDDEEHSSEVIEMIQPPHTLRHQEHYKQRILQAAEKDFPHKHDQQQDDSYDDDGEEDEEESSQHNRHLRYQQIQLALREPITTPTPTQTPPPPPQQHHHRRHEHHFGKQRLAKQTEFKWPQQHHLRYQHQQQNLESIHNLPQLRHQRHETRKQNLTTATVKPLYQRYFDRESLYLNPLAKIATTEGPHLRHKGVSKHIKSIISSNPHNRLFNDDAESIEGNHLNTNNNEEDIKRFSLLSSLEVNSNEDKPTNDNLSLDEENENAFDGLIDNDDYSYEDDDKKEMENQNKYPSISSNPKTNVKRYTNPMRSLYKLSLSSSNVQAGGNRGYGVGYSSYHVEHLNSNINDDDEYDDKSLSSSSESSNDNDDKFSDEKWNKIEHEHYRKQLQHQRAMQALRSRRPVIDNSANKLSSPSTSSLSSLSYNAAATQRQIIYDDDTDNIYSRYYVPGSVTHKKEEELSSPTAISESRRQYALQQRQNKALASAHHRRIVTEGSCRLPQPRVERIRRDSWKIYTPHCTILHRCADDTGCCPSERQTCAPKRTKNVDLYFFVISLNETQGSVEKLTFINHTECHCVDKSKQRAPEYAASGTKELITNQITYLRRAAVLNCNCPNLYEKILQEDGYCRCDCSSGNMGCDWLKRGMEHFSMNDRKCIIEGRCKLPTCEYGQYIKKHGRCPRREERQLSADVEW